MITQALNLNLIPGQVLPRVNVSQYDSGTRTLQMSLYNGTQAFNVTSGVLGFIQGTKPDRTGFQYSATVTSGSNVVTADITQQMTAVSGDVVTELVLVSGDDQIATVNFIIHVEAAALADDTVISDTELPLIEEAAELAERIDGIIAQIDADADKSEAYAVGTKGGTPVPSTDPTYHNNSKYYSEQAAASAASIGDLAADAEAWAVGTRDGSAVPSTDPAYHNNSKYYAQDAGDKATAAGTSATSASTNALKAEGFAVGEQNGTAVTSGSPYYHNNAEYFAGEASTSATNASTSETNAGLSESAAAQSEEDSEAWAIGERNGVPVTSGDPTYQNNAKYYAQQAGGTALSSLVDVAISGATNGQVLGYNSTSQKWENESLGSAAAKNSTNAVTSGSTDLVESGAVYTEIDSVKSDLSNMSNRNLLDNPWFTVNQRGQSSYTSNNSYTVDRWKDIYSANLTVNVTENGVTLIRGDSTTRTDFCQRMEGATFAKLIGKTITFSVMLSDGTIKSGTVEVPDSIVSTPSVILNFNVDNDWTATIYGRVTGLGANIEVGTDVTNTSISIKAVKLELGSVSTLAQDTAPNYAEELLKCQRYFYRLKGDSVSSFFVNGVVHTTSTVRGIVNFPSAMRVAPSVTKSGAVEVGDVVSGWAGGGVASFSLNGFCGNQATIIATTTNTTNMVVGHPVVIQGHNDVNAYLDFSADL